MSVLECDRRGCDQIMCGRISYFHQMYICNECFDELCSLGVDQDIEVFMHTEKKSPLPEKIRVDPYEYFGKIFETF